MESNTSTLSSPETRAGGVPTMSDWVPAGLEGLAATVAELAAGDPDQLGDALLAAQVVALRRLVDQLEGAWLHRLAAVDGRGAAGAEAGTQAPSTTAWLRATCRMSPGFAGQLVRTARALHRGPLAATAAALATGAVSYPHAATLADATHDLPPTKVAEAEPVLVDAARRLDPGRLRRLTAHLRDVIDPEKAEQRAGARLDRRGLWLAATVDGMVAVDGLLDPEAGEAAQAALAPLARPAGPDDARTAAQRRADALGELARQALQTGRLPQGGGLRPQLTVTRAIVHRHPNPADPGQPSSAEDGVGLATRLRDTLALLPPPLGAPTELLDLGRATRVLTPAMRRALALRDRGCIAAGCDRPPPWTDAHHLHHWLHGGPTSLDNLVLLCRTHHLAVHEGGWQLRRDSTSGQATLTPPARHHPYRGHSPPAA